MTITALVPAYNEALTIGPILDELLRIKGIKQVVVIDDGSTDATASIASDKGVKVLRLEPNRGKSHAVLMVESMLTTDVVFFCDADLCGFTVEMADDIIRPVISGKVAMQVGLRDYGLLNPLLGRFPPISGERAVLTEVVLKAMKSPLFSGWGMELVLNHYCDTNNLPWGQKVYPYHHRHQLEKRGFLDGVRGVIGQVWELGKVTYHYNRLKKR